MKQITAIVAVHALPLRFTFGVIFTGLILLSGLLLSPPESEAASLRSAYTTVHFESHRDLDIFNRKLGCVRASNVCLGHSSLPEATTGYLLSTIIDHIQSLLDLHPEKIHFHVHILPNVEDVQYTYKRLYGAKCDYIAFYSPHTKTVYIASEKLRKQVLYHEIAHALLDSYFEKTPSVRIHELLAQYVESEIQ